MKLTSVITASILLFLAVPSFAQNSIEHQVTDTTARVIVHQALIDSAYYGLNILTIVQEPCEDASVSIKQSDAIKNALENQIANNSNRKIQGYRVRIYFDNNKNARAQSESIAQAFAEAFPTQRVYRNYVSPYFKVTVGDFRTRTEAQIFAEEISNRYPSVFLVKEAINYPDL